MGRPTLSRSRVLPAAPVVGAVDLKEDCSLWHSRSTKCRCSPGCAVCGYGKHQSLHGPEFGNPPGSRPWHHQFVPGDDPPHYDDNDWDWRKHPREDWPASEPEGEL